MVDLEVIQENIINMIAYDNLFLDELPSDFDFVNDIGIVAKIGDSIQDNIYRDDLTLELRLVGTKNKKIDMQRFAIELEQKLNKTYFLNCRIIKQNAFYSSYIDEDKQNIVLQFYIFKY